jgi:UPF0271 protein
MVLKNKTKIYILDTSAILSGIPINLKDAEMFTTNSISKELKPGGRDYRTFQFLKEKGLSIISPSKKSIEKIKTISIKTGDKNRLSNADTDVLALALDMKINDKRNVILLTDDYSMQNLAYVLDIKFENIGKPKITKKFKWGCRCLGCRKKFHGNIKICPICGAETKDIISKDEDIKKSM